MENFINVLLDPLKDFWTGFIVFVPKFIAMVIIFAGGVVIAWGLKLLLLRTLLAANFDTWADKAGLTAIIRKGDIWGKPSDLSGKILYWFIVIIFLMIGLNALQIQTIDKVVSQFFLYLPRIFSALLIFVIGYVIAGFISRAVLIAAVNSGYHYAKILAEAVRLMLIVFILAMVLEQLSVAPSIVVAAFSIMFGGVVIALAIAFGVGGIDAARRIIEKGSEEKQEAEKDVEHL
ncbi:MAG: hypothetical protein A2Z50_04345 [Nitrospirae bacterium RBG_19FT_COMBO_42_15]|nr:MAG: hypothetical protein A2Z50_04345 [Nitrospirae bacterium RBG_19FT_COMBO_42_15]